MITLYGMDVMGAVRGNNAALPQNGRGCHGYTDNFTEATSANIPL